MQPSRRQVLRWGGAALVIGGHAAFAERALAAMTPAHLVRRSFRPLVGSTFRFSGGGKRYNAILVSVGDLPNSRPGDPNRFRLLFAVRGAGPQQDTYRFSHARLAPFPLFVVPVGARRGRYYEAVVVSA